MRRAARIIRIARGSSGGLPTAIVHGKVDAVTGMLDAFFTELIARSDPRPRRASASAELVELYGAPLDPALAAWVDVFGTHEPRTCFGELGWFGRRGGFTVDWLPGDADSLSHALAEPFRLPGPLASGLGIGCDRGGNTYFATLWPAGAVTEVYWHDQDEDTVLLLADSLEAFATLLRRDEGTLPADTADGVLVGHVDVDARSGRGASGALVPRTAFARRFAATCRLRAALTYGDSSYLDGSIAITGDDAWARAVRLLDAHLRGDDDRVAGWIPEALTGRSKWLRDVAARVRANTGVTVSERARALTRPPY